MNSTRYSVTVCGNEIDIFDINVNVSDGAMITIDTNTKWAVCLYFCVPHIDVDVTVPEICGGDRTRICVKFTVSDVQRNITFR